MACLYKKGSLSVLFSDLMILSLFPKVLQICLFGYTLPFINFQLKLWLEQTSITEMFFFELKQLSSLQQFKLTVLVGLDLIVVTCKNKHIESTTHSCDIHIYSQSLIGAYKSKPCDVKTLLTHLSLIVS
jgi:hypothetical protein